MNKNENQNNKDIEAALAKMHEALPQAIDVLIELASSKNPKIRDRANREIRERILGKPTKIFRLK
jgi:hypothetical protein